MKIKKNFGKLLKIALILLIVAIMNNGCKSKLEVTSNKEVVRIDSVFIKKIDTVEILEKVIEKIYVPSDSNFNLGNPCDSLGNLKKMNFNTKVGNLLTKINTMDGDLNITIKELDSLRDIIRIKDAKLKSQDISYQVLRNAVLENESRNKTTIVWSKWTYIFLGLFLATLALLLSKIRIFIPTIF